MLDKYVYNYINDAIWWSMQKFYMWWMYECMNSAGCGWCYDYPIGRCLIGNSHATVYGGCPLLRWHTDCNGWSINNVIFLIIGCAIGALIILLIIGCIIDCVKKYIIK